MCLCDVVKEDQESYGHDEDEKEITYDDIYLTRSL